MLSGNQLQIIEDHTYSLCKNKKDYPNLGNKQNTNSIVKT